MIIDAILDRKDGQKYNSYGFCEYTEDELKIFKMDYKFVKAIKDGDEELAKKELCRYIDEQYDGNKEIKDYINSVEWADTNLSYKEKEDYCYFRVIDYCACIWDLFVDNVGSEAKIRQRLEECKTRKDIRKFIAEYI